MNERIERERPRVWRQRYAGFEPDLHNAERILSTLKPVRYVLPEYGSVRDLTPSRGAPLHPVKRVTGLKVS